MAHDDSGSDTNDSREQGVDFGRLKEVLNELTYPITRSALLDEFGEYELETAGG
jgi:hypothetical protein